jgi:hypothetical protein
LSLAPATSSDACDFLHKTAAGNWLAGQPFRAVISQ